MGFVPAPRKTGAFAVFADHVVLPAALGGQASPLTVQPALVRVAGTTFESVTPMTREAFGRLPDRADVIDLGGRLVTPAFVNAHTHIAMAIFRGIGGTQAQGGNVIEDIYFALEPRLSAEDVRAFARVGAYESLLGGVGLVWDHYYHGEAVAKALVDTGLCGVVAPTLQDDHGPGVQALDAQWDATLTLDDPRWARKGIFSALGPHATDTVSNALWERVATLAAQRNLPVHAHVAQSIEELRLSHARHGVSPVARLERLGVLERARMLLVHGIFVSRPDLAKLDPARHTMGFCPYSQLQFAYPADVSAWIEAQLSWIVATDCACSNDSMDVQKELRLVAGMRVSAATHDAAHQQFMTSGNASDADLAHAARQRHWLRGGALGDASFLLSRVWSVPGALHPAVTAGVLRAGALANLAVWDLDHPAFWPGQDPLRALTLSGTQGALDALCSNGQWVGQRGSFAQSLLAAPEYRDAVREANARLARHLSALGLSSRA